MMIRMILITIAMTFALLLSCSEEQDITTENIRQSEPLFDLQFTAAERDSMLDGVQELRNNYQTIHKLTLENAVSPALVFDPRPKEFQMPDQSSRFVMSDYSKTVFPVDSADLAFYTIGQLGHLLRSGRLSSVSLTRFCLQRLVTLGPKLECVVTLTEQRALEQARRADRELAAGLDRGPLHGIPYGIKDLFSTSAYKTTWGAVPYREQQFGHDATVVKKLEEAGAVLVAKLTLGALAWGDVWFGGKTRNPWNVQQGSSGSSAGSAAAVSAGLVPFAIGTETWGSIVSPSTVCGTTGLRPTFGRVSRHGAMALSWSMDKIGPITRSVEDAAMVFKALIGEDGLDASVIEAPFSYQPDIDPAGIRLGYLKSDFESDYAFRKQDSLALLTLRNMGLQLTPVSLPDLPVGDLSFILSAEAAAAFDALTRSNRDDLMVRQIKNAWPNVFRTARLIPAVEYINANRLRSRLIEEMQQLMQTVDMYVAPSWQGDNLLLTNLSGHPCVVLPNGFSEEGTPTSITFMGKLFDEGRLLALARMYQEHTGFHLKHPQIQP